MTREKEDLPKASGNLFLTFLVYTFQTNVADSNVTEINLQFLQSSERAQVRQSHVMGGVDTELQNATKFSPAAVSQI